MTESTKTINEILAPAGSPEQLYAAVKSGADAVYFGTSGFNARRNAANFSDEEFTNAVKYCHERGVKAYITLNTLVTDSEMTELIKTLKLIAVSGADAVIVQDFAVIEAVKKHCPTLPLHASTQMAVHNVSGAKLLEKLGFARIVLARELSYAEIKTICSAVKTEIEVFVHGAHCMSVSGMCYMSSALGARSGNRGLCAQPCRLNFKYKGREYALSLKDMSSIEHITELSEAGVCSYKIEGRMKRPEYVAAAVTAVKQAINGQKPDLVTLKNIFSRNGFTDGYFAAKRNLDMFGFRTKDDVIAAQSVLQPLQALYKDEYKSVKINISLSVKNNKPSLLTVSDGKNTVTVTGSVAEPAQKMEITKEYAEKSLLKLGGTPYYADGVNCDIDGGLMLPASALNALRRDALTELSQKRQNSVTHAFTVPPKEELPAAVNKTELERLFVRFEKAEQIPSALVCDRIILPLAEVIANKALINSFKSKLTPEIPVLLYPADEKHTEELLTELKSLGITSAMCENIGAVYLAEKCGLTPVGGHMLSVLNSRAFMQHRAMGLEDITLSSEMSFNNMRRLSVNGNAGFVAYGHMPLMRFRCCPMQGIAGCGGCSGKNELLDRRNTPLTVICSQKQYQTLYNPVPLYTGNMLMPQMSFYTLYFSYETKEECAEVISLFRKRLSPPFQRTAGLYDKELL